LSACWALWVRGPRDSLVPACRCQSVTGLDFGGSSADVKVQSAEWLRRSGRLAGRLVGAWVEVRKTPRNSNLVTTQRMKPEGEIPFAVQIGQGVIQERCLLVFIKVRMEEDVDERLQTVV